MLYRKNFNYSNFHLRRYSARQINRGYNQKLSFKICGKKSKAKGVNCLTKNRNCGIRIKSLRINSGMQSWRSQIVKV
jgi:hypothetical protein